MLVFNGRYIAMQIMENTTYKEARNQADQAANPFNGIWIDLVEVRDENPVDLNQVVKSE